MTRYVVQITRTYEVQADDDEEAVEAALEEEGRYPAEPLMNVTDLDEAARVSDQP